MLINDRAFFLILAMFDMVEILSKFQVHVHKIISSVFELLQAIFVGVSISGYPPCKSPKGDPGP